jgi:hypothetical protein
MRWGGDIRTGNTLKAAKDVIQGAPLLKNAFVYEPFIDRCTLKQKKLARQAPVFKESVQSKL